MTGHDDIDYASRTDVGIRRSHNQDAHVVMPATDPDEFRQRGHVFLVADGMGGHAVGELAAKIAVDNIPHIYSKHTDEGPEAAIRKAFLEANCSINNRGNQNREFRGMGTTAVTLILRPEGAWVANVGDSRVYRVRRGHIEQLSFDHSWVWELARKYNKRPEEVSGVGANRITRSLGPDPLVQVDVDGPHSVQPGDVFLLCTDGLSGQVNDREIGAVVSVLPPEEACEFLVHLANLQGGIDNVTVAVIRVGGPEEGADSEANRRPRISVAAIAAAVGRRAATVLRRLPWAFMLLGAGLLLAIAALAMTAFHTPGYYLAFVFAGLAILGGLVGVMVQNFRETRGKPAAAPVPRPIVVHRTTPCPIEPALLERLAQATRDLEESVHEKGWQLDDDAYHSHLRQSELATERNALREAFAEQCRALMVLMTAVAQQRNREESFRPLWDRPAVG